MTDAAGHPAPLRLEYRAEPSPVTTRRVASLLALLPGLVVPFVPFACGFSPTELVADAGTQLLGPEPFADADELMSGLLGLSAFIAFPLVAWALRRLWPGPPSRGCRAALFLAAAAGWFAVTVVLGSLTTDIDPADAWEWPVLGTSAALLCLAAAAVVLLTVQRRGAEQRITAALAGPYAAIFVLLLVGYAAGRQVGWYLALGPTAAAVAEVMAATAFALRRSAGA